LPLTDGRLLATVGREAVRLGMSVTPAVARLRPLTTPCIIGVLRPVLLLPAEFGTTVSPRDVGLVIAHELAHNPTV